MFISELNSGCGSLYMRGLILRSDLAGESANYIYYSLVVLFEFLL